MNTLDKLQKHLAGTVTEHRPGFLYKKPAPVLHCNDGTSASIQASDFHYSTPRENVGPYTEVEVWKVSADVTEFEYDPADPSAYVPIEDVVRFIDNHGGIAE